MQDFLVEPIPNCWDSWDHLIEASGVHFSQDQHELGKTLFQKNTIPAKSSQIVYIDHGDQATTVTDLIAHPRFFWMEFSHPILLLTLIARMRWKSNWHNRIERHIKHQVIMSPYLLAHEGENYILLLTRNKKGFYGKFKNLKVDDHLPKCMHLWTHLTYSRHKPKSMYVRGNDGMYEEHKRAIA